MRFLFLSGALLGVHFSPQLPAADLFDGQSLAGWTGQGWHVVEGAMQAEGRREISWKEPVADFVVEFDYQCTGAASVQVRTLCCSLTDGSITGANERGVLMKTGTRTSIAPDGRRWEDPVGTIAMPQRPDWQHCRVKAVGSHVEVWINATFCGALDDHATKDAAWMGPLGFRLVEGKLALRHVQLQDLGRTEFPSGSATTAAEAAAIPVRGEDGRVLNFNFETGTLADWTATGDAWKEQPIKGDTVHPRKPSEASQHTGEFWLGGYEPTHTDAGMGTLTSVPFIATEPWASCLIGGGKDPAMVRLEIVESATGKVFHTATGRGVENLVREVVDLRPVLGKALFLRLVDQGKGGWQHLNFDDFVFHKAAPAQLAEGSRATQSPVLWHLRDNPAKPTAVPNAEAQATVAGMKLTAGFQMELIAAEPEVVQPIAFAIDDRGRLWVVEGLSYPNKQPEGKGRDRIVIYGDKDGDGRFETRTVFQEGLNLASGIELGFGGVFIGAAPQLLFIPDRDGDDKPDGPPEVLLDGWGFQDTHETLNSFSWGPDGWLYGCHGVFSTANIGKPGTPADQRVPMHAGVWRFHPVRREFEVFAHGGSNQWGIDYDETGHWFMTHCRSFYGGGGTTYVIPHAHYWNQANAGYAPFISNAGPDFAPGLKNYLPAAARYDSGEGGAGKPGTTAIFGGHSHVGTMIYQGTNWPAAYRGHLFTNNLHGQQMNHQVNVRSGTGFETMHGGADMAFSPDPRYMAVDLQSGPDGAVYLIDWYDQQHCHTPVEEKWDRTNGRIYRLSWAATYQPVSVDLRARTDVELAQMQTHEDDWYARHARRLLMERAALEKVDATALALLAKQASHAAAPLALRALWALHQCGRLDAALLNAAAHHADEAVRAWAIQLGHGQLEGLAELASGDPSGMVRLALASALPEMKSEVAWEIATLLAGHAEDAEDRFLPSLLWSGLAPLAAADWPRALKLAASTPLVSLADSIRWYAGTSELGREALDTATAELSAESAGRVMRILAFAVREETRLKAPAAWPQVVRTVGALAAVDELAAVFGDESALVRVRQQLANAQTPLPSRRAALALLKRLGDSASLPVFASLLDNDAFRSAVIPLLGRSDDPAIASALIQRYAKFNPTDRAAALAALTSRVPLALALVQAMQDGSFSKKECTSLHLRQMRNLGHAGLNEKLATVWGKISETSAEARTTIAKFKQLYQEAPLWAYDAGKGREVFTKACSTCHAHGEGEAKIGPNLGGTWGNGIDYFIENIADPNAVVGDDYQLHVIKLTDGNVVAGALEKDTLITLTLRTIIESITISKDKVQSREKLAQSLMPPGLLESLSEREAIELLKFLTNKP